MARPVIRGDWPDGWPEAGDVGDHALPCPVYKYWLLNLALQYVEKLSLVSGTPYLLPTCTNL